MDRTLSLIRESGCKAGLVFNPASRLASSTTPLSPKAPLSPKGHDQCLVFCAPPSLSGLAYASVKPSPAQATPLDCLKYVMDKVDIILLMSVNPGFGGQSFIPATLTKAREHPPSCTHLFGAFGGAFSLSLSSRLFVLSVCGA